MISMWNPNVTSASSVSNISPLPARTCCCCCPRGTPSNPRGWLKGKSLSWKQGSSCCPPSFPVGTRVICENSKYLSLLVFSWCLFQMYEIPGTREKSRFTPSIIFSWFYKLTLSKASIFHDPRIYFLLSDRNMSTWLDIYNKTWPYGSGYPEVTHERALRKKYSKILYIHRNDHTYGWSFIYILGDCPPGQSSLVKRKTKKKKN